MLTVSDAQRRARLVRRHLLAPGLAASSPADAAAGVVVLHATDPAPVYLSVLARCPGASLDDVSAALYDEGSLVKMIGMRRTMFVVPAGLAPVVHSAAGIEIAARLRRRLVTLLETTPTDPPLGSDLSDVPAWLDDVLDSVEEALIARGEAFANELAADEPRLRTALLPTSDKNWNVKQNITSLVLTLLGAEGRAVRGRPAGTWMSRKHRWMAAGQVWPDGVPPVPEGDARVELAREWLRVFGPATVADLQWWTGWTVTATRATLSRIDTVDVDLGGVDGIVLADDVEFDQPAEPSAVLLPALDPTPMGWKHRDFYLGPHRERLFDRNGNIGPTLWWDGRIVGGWGMRGTEIVWRFLEDVGGAAEKAVAEVAGELRGRLDAATVIPTFRTPLERELST